MRETWTKRARCTGETVSGFWGLIIQWQGFVPVASARRLSSTLFALPCRQTKAGASWQLHADASCGCRHPAHMRSQYATEYATVVQDCAQAGASRQLHVCQLVPL
jgi:hypothetical protein